MNILIVEPSQAYSQLIQGLLSGREVSLTIAHSGEEAIDYMHNQSPDAICVTHELGDMNSIEFMAYLKKHKICNDKPVFLITSNNSEEFRRQSYDAGFTEIFTKSDIAVLKNTFRSIMLYTTSQIKARVLYVEDVFSTAAYTMSIMTNLGWEVDLVDSARQALEYLDKHEYDIVITDLVLPGELSGVGLISVIREQDKKRSWPMPIMAISGWNDLLRQVFVLQHGHCDFMAKPFQENDFIARVINLIQSKRMIESSFKEKQILKDKAHTDSLTGLYNRYYLDEVVNNHIKVAIDRGIAISVLMIDIDYFKEINDKYGHQVGDRVIKQLGANIHENCREHDIAVRYGGEEFLVILPGCNYQNAILKAEHLREAVSSEENEGYPVPITVSIGISYLDKLMNNSLDELIKIADIALYQSKEKGRNQTTAFKVEDAISA
ncbi:MAG: diguanylate cyclase [Gammaproteobacteria bacterium]|nr:diguanylate cyclase [Gammaproteobacteria bacterium]